MRTTITISDAVMKDVLQYAHTKKFGEAVNIALREWIRLSKINELKKLRGTLVIDNNLQILKKNEKEKLRKLNESK